mmetsp:Transcript_5049/g.9587  ORF Transcript_5049/g.9587 Transcript_5049/m.9587 type:complete len:95 (-) Transcript_5049:79-363(-)
MGIADDQNLEARLIRSTLDRGGGNSTDATSLSGAFAEETTMLLFLLTSRFGGVNELEPVNAKVVFCIESVPSRRSVDTFILPSYFLIIEYYTEK